MQNTLKTKIIKNTVQIIVGFILLGISFAYLQDHPAEKTSVISGFQVLFQRLQIFFVSILGGDGAYLDEKYKTQRNLKELGNTIINNKCLTDEDYKKVMEVFDIVSKMDIQTYKEKRFDIHSFLYSYLRKIEENCGNRIQNNF